MDIGTRINTVLLVILVLIGLTLIAMLATSVRGGPLDPPAPPGSTGIPINEAGSWSQTLSDTGGCNSERFKCVLNNEAVLDRETRLVWQRTISNVEVNWPTARFLCQATIQGGRFGWRLPTVAELYTVGDGADNDGPVPGMPLLSAGAPSREYWTSTTSSGSPTLAATVNFDLLNIAHVELKTEGSFGFWCVRGPDPADGPG